MRRRALPFLLVALGLVGAGARAGDFVGSGICQFKLESYILLPDTERAINAAVSKSLDQHRGVFGFKPEPDFKVRMRIFGRYEDYEDFTLRDKASHYVTQHAGSLTNLSGYYSHETREVVSWRQAQPGHLANNILHEASHAIMLAHYRRVPTWVGEGCATYFSFPPQLQDEFDVGSLKYRWAELNLWLRRGQLPAVTNFVNLTHEEWQRQPFDKAYSVSWSLFQFLMSTPDNQRVLRQIMTELQQGRRGRMDCATLITRFYRGGITRFEQNWHNWIVQGGRRILGPDIEQILKQIG